MSVAVLGSSLPSAALAVAVATPGAAAAATRPGSHSQPLVGAPGATTPRALGAHARARPRPPTTGRATTTPPTGPSARSPPPGSSRACARPARPSPTPPSGSASTATTRTRSSRSAPRAGARAWPATTPGTRCIRSTRWRSTWRSTPATCSPAPSPGRRRRASRSRSSTRRRHETYTTGQLMDILPALASAEVIAEAPSDGEGDVLPRRPTTASCASAAAPSTASRSARSTGTASTWSREYSDAPRRPNVATLGADGASFSVTTDVHGAPHDGSSAA